MGFGWWLMVLAAGLSRVVGDLQLLVQQQLKYYKDLQDNTRHTASKALCYECFSREETRCRWPLSSRALSVPVEVEAYTADSADVGDKPKMAAPYWSLGPVSEIEGDPSGYKVLITEGAKERSWRCGEVSLRINPFLCVFMPAQSELHQGALHGKGRILGGMVESTSGTAVLALHLAHQLAKIENFPLSQADIWDGLTWKISTLPRKAFVDYFGSERGVVSGYVRGFFFVVTHMVKANGSDDPGNVDNWTPELLDQVHRTVCPKRTGARGREFEHMKHGERTIPPLATEVPELVSTFLEWLQYHHRQGCVNRILLALRAKSFLSWIHPWRDCNGRTARLLMAALLLQEGVVPPFFDLGPRVAYTRGQSMAYYGDFDAFDSHLLRNLHQSGDSLAQLVEDMDRETVEQLQPDVPAWSGFGSARRDH